MARVKAAVLLAIGRKPRRKRHVGKLADDLSQARFDIVEIDPWPPTGERHVGDLLGRR